MPKISATRCLELLRRQASEAEQIGKLHHDDPEVTRWQSLTLQIVASYFGKGHDNYEKLDTVFGSTVGFGGASDSFYQTQHEGQVKEAKAYIMSMLDQIELLSEVTLADKPAINKPTTNKIFIVHGHADQPKTELALLLTRLKLEPIILHEKANQGLTLIEKLERNSEDVGYAFILLTPDDVGGEAKRLKGDRMFTQNALRPRARQNVVFEFGRFVGLIGRSKVCCLYAGDIELPSDIQGLVYIKFNSSINEAQLEIVKELRAAGYEVAV